MEPRGCNRWQSVANVIRAEAAKTSEIRCRGLRPVATSSAHREVSLRGPGSRRRHAREQLDRLTEREREVAIAIGLGKSNADISRELYMSVATVKAHVSRVLEKLELNNRVQIALLSHDADEA